MGQANPSQSAPQALLRAVSNILAGERNRL